MHMEVIITTVYISLPRSTTLSVGSESLSVTSTGDHTYSTVGVGVTNPSLVTNTRHIGDTLAAIHSPNTTQPCQLGRAHISEGMGDGGAELPLLPSRTQKPSSFSKSTSVAKSKAYCSFTWRASRTSGSCGRTTGADAFNILGFMRTSVGFGRIAVVRGGARRCIRSIVGCGETGLALLYRPLCCPLTVATPSPFTIANLTFTAWFRRSP